MNIEKVNPIDLKFNKNRIEFQQKMIRMEYWQCCANCQQKEQCFKTFGTPPIEVTTTGCENYTSIIPF